MKIEEMADAYEQDFHKTYPNGVDIRNYCNTEFPSIIYTQGWKDCLKHDESVNELVKTIENIHVYSNNSQVIVTVKEALSKFREKVGE